MSRMLSTLAKVGRAGGRVFSAWPLAPIGAWLSSYLLTVLSKTAYSDVWYSPAEATILVSEDSAENGHKAGILKATVAMVCVMAVVLPEVYLPIDAGGAVAAVSVGLLVALGLVGCATAYHAIERPVELEGAA